ncbi:U11/U12 small nuclear ribonucleoprotein 48 kDa protein [Habropoda laboriosa]|uniref:U11/U12 small nuclear ribonucleoprotein 48 kDa protein n=1 Tax=Habropoda laboriosa TaxID=597456 RepID=A0A0L7R6T5_9HYME|nr:PREDICTED: U11/U12 small nuclear ribonucleoprotein 48 kDa protein-like [Habropoda laboriosa]KOC66602.1 U11/U12 small nuclear ribonucleoprotein 48 kDa protein [Habropoda laboriosa]
MLNRTMNERKEQRQTLSNFTKKINREIIETASTLDWTIESIETDNDSRLICPYDPSHQMGKKMLDQHLESCHWKQEGYNEFDVPLPESTLSLDSYSSIKLDSPLQNAILQEAKRIDSTMNIGLGERLIPRTSDRIFTDFTCDERKVLYQYVVSNTVKTDIGHDITDTHQVKCQDKEDKKLSFLELLIQERNLKRRRAKHRGVHTNKKSHTEILREVIHQQMELYIDYITETRASNRSTKTSAIAEMQTSEGGNLDDIQTSALSVNQVPPKHHHNLLVEDSQDYSESSSSRNEQKHEYFEKSNASYAKDSERREKSSRKLHKRKRSRSRERDHDKKSKYESSRSSYKKNMKSYETGRTLNSSTYSKRNIDRRNSREKSIL